MSRKHYIEAAALIADRIAWFDTDDQYSALQSVARGLADMFQADNPRFDRERFLTACGL